MDILSIIRHKTPPIDIARYVLRFLIQQGVTATALDNEGDTRCVYRGDNGTQCAVGCLIDDALAAMS